MMYLPQGTPFYVDMLVGEYLYIDQYGIERVNTINNIYEDYENVFNYNLISIGKTSILDYPKCNECPVGTERLAMEFDEPLNDDAGLSAEFVMRRVIENGLEKLKVQFVSTNAYSDMNKSNFELPSTFRDFSLPYGNYTLIKQ